MAFRRRVDFYFWKGIPVARRWPRYDSGRVRSTLELEQVENFTAAAKITGGLASDLVDAYKAEMYGVGVTWVDNARSTALARPWRFRNV